MGKPVPNAFTLIELLVVISIMAIIGVYTLANYESFGEDRNLKNAVLDVASILRQAQTSATSNTKCNTGYSATWQVEFAADNKTINLKCQEPLPSPLPIIKKTLTLGSNIVLQSVSGLQCLETRPFTIYFAPLNGKITLGGETNCTLLSIILRNSKTTNTKSLVIEKGGRIYGQ